MPTVLEHAPYYAAAAIAAAGAGVLLAWSLRRHTMISIRNVYLTVALIAAVDALALGQRAGWALVVLVPRRAC
jgi:hypothetical protein